MRGVGAVPSKVQQAWVAFGHHLGRLGAWLGVCQPAAGQHSWPSWSFPPVRLMLARRVRAALRAEEQGGLRERR